MGFMDAMVNGAFPFPHNQASLFTEGDLVYTPLQIFPHGEGRWSQQADSILLLDGGKAGYAVEEEGKLIPIFYEVTPLEKPVKKKRPVPFYGFKSKKGKRFIEKLLLYDAPIFEPIFGTFLKFQPVVARVPIISISIKPKHFSGQEPQPLSPTKPKSLLMESPLPC